MTTPADAIQVVNCGRLVEQISDAIMLARALDHAPTHVNVNQWHFDCLLVWAIERWELPQDTIELMLYEVPLQPGDVYPELFMVMWTTGAK